MLRIKNAEDFGLGFNCMTRLYMANYEEEILDDMFQVCKEYLKYFSSRTIVCSLRDLVEDYSWSRSNQAMPENQKERYEKLIATLTKQGISKEREKSRYRDEKMQIMSFIDTVGFQGSIYGKDRNLTNEDVYLWIMENNLNEEAEIKSLGKKDELPLKKKNIPLFYKVCNYMIRYSYGRHTYMPGTCRDFVKDNMDIFTDEVLKQILLVLIERNANISEDEPAIYKIDSETWLHMQKELEAELLVRDYKCLAEEYSEVQGGIVTWLGNLLDYDKLSSQKDCRQMYYQILGVERYVSSVKDNVTDVERVTEVIEIAKKTITEKLWYFFELEEGDKYEKISEGVYQNRCNN